MIASLVLAIFFSLLLLFNYKKGVVISAMTIQLLSYVGTGIPGVKIYFFISFLALCLYPFHYKNVSKDSYPEWIGRASIFFLCSFAITTILSGFMHWDTVLVNFISYFVFPFLFWKCLDSKKQVNLAIKLLVGLMTVAVIVGLIEAIFRVNIIFETIQKVLVLEDFYFDDERIRFGLKRSNSIFAYFSTYGVSTWVAFIVFYVNKYILHNKSSMWMTILVYLCAFAAFSTGSRAIFLGLFLSCFMLLGRKKFIKSKSGATFLYFSFLLLPVLLVVGNQVLDSMVNSDTSKYASGSSAGLRMIQWEACESYFLDSPIIGNGRMYIWDVVREAHFELRGAESIWFSILVDYGIVGGFAFLFLVFACCKHLWSCNSSLVCLPIGYLLILSLSPDQGITYNLLITFTLLIIRMFQAYPINKDTKGVACC